MQTIHELQKVHPIFLDSSTPFASIQATGGNAELVLLFGQRRLAAHLENEGGKVSQGFLDFLLHC